MALTVSVYRICVYCFILHVLIQHLASTDLQSAVALPSPLSFSLARILSVRSQLPRRITLIMFPSTTSSSSGTSSSSVEGEAAGVGFGVGVNSERVGEG